MQPSSYSEAWARRWAARQAAYEEERRAVYSRLEAKLATAAELLRSQGVRQAWLYGSFLDGTWRPDSDVDLAVEPGPDSPRNLFRLEAALEDLLSQTVHLTVLRVLPPAIQEVIRQEGRRLVGP